MDTMINTLLHWTRAYSCFLLSLDLMRPSVRPPTLLLLKDKKLEIESSLLLHLLLCSSVLGRVLALHCRLYHPPRCLPLK